MTCVAESISLEFILSLYTWLFNALLRIYNTAMGKQ